MLNIVIVRKDVFLRRHYAEFIAKEINLQGYLCHIVTIDELKNYLVNNNLSPGNTIIHTRTAHPEFVYIPLKELENQGYKIINSPETIKATSDKFNTFLLASKYGIPTAASLKVKKTEAGQLIKKQLSVWPKLIVKPITSKGQGEFCFKFSEKNLAELSSLDLIQTEEVVIQEFIEHERLSRVITIGYKPLDKAICWDAPGQNWKCSVCLNPHIKHYQNPPTELLDFAANIARKFNGEVSFIDIFTTKQGYCLNEINTACNLTIHERITGVNISKKIADYLIKAARKLGMV